MGELALGNSPSRWAGTGHSAAISRQASQLRGAEVPPMAILEPTLTLTRGPGFTHQVVALGRDDFRGLGVPDHQVSVRAHSHSPLPWVKIEDFGCICTGHSNELVLVHFP